MLHIDLSSGEWTVVPVEAPVPRHNITPWREQQDRQCTYNVTLRRFRESLLPWKSNKYYILMCACVLARLGEWACACACVRVALLMQHATRMRRVVTSFVAFVSTRFFGSISKRYDFRKKVTEHQMCFDFLYNFPWFQTFTVRWILIFWFWGFTRCVGWVSRRRYGNHCGSPNLHTV